MRRAGTAAVAAVLAAVAAGLAACGGSHQAIGPGSFEHHGAQPVPPRPHSGSPTSPSTSISAPTTTVPPYLSHPAGQPWLARGTAPWVAAQYIEASDSVSWTWRTPAQYLYDARPYMTRSLYRLLDGVERKAISHGGAPGDAAYWHRLVERHDGTYVQIDFAYIATEAGVTRTSEVVRVAYWLGSVTGGVTEPVDTEHVSTIVDLSMEKIDGRWEVSGIQSPEAG